MNAHKKLLAPAKGGMQMTRYLHRLFGAFVFVVAMVFLLGTPGAWAETYSSFASSYPSKFDNDCFDTVNNDMQYMDAVYFGGREIIFFTLFSNNKEYDIGKTYSRYLYFYSNDPSYAGSLDIGNDTTLNFRIKVFAMDDVLYVFYTAAAPENGYDTFTIYYRTAKVDHGIDGKDWKLDFSEMKSFFAYTGSPVKIQTVQVMNGTIYVIYSAGSILYCITSSDGQNFVFPTTLFATNDIQGVGAAVFQVPDATEGSVDKMMIAYTDTAYTLRYGFFDGRTPFSPTPIETSGLKPASVRLIAGSAQDYSNRKYSIQVFITHDQDSKWHSIYHREYTPAGANGDQGTWSAAWNKLAISDDDAVHCHPDHVSDSGWAVIPFFASEDAKAGTFTLSFEGATTTSLAYNASANEVQDALNSLSTIGGRKDSQGYDDPGSVTVSLSGNVYTVTFGGSLANTDVDQMFGDGRDGAYALVATTTPGVDVSEVQTVTVSAANVGMHVRLWYAKGSHWSGCKDQLNFRCSSYLSDLLYYQSRTEAPAGIQDLSTSTVLGVIEGTPPYPENGAENETWPETNDYSTVQLGKDTGYKVSSAWTVSSSVTVSYGKKFEKKSGLKVKYSFGLDYTKGSTHSATASIGEKFWNFTHDPRGDMGWVLVLKPDILNDQYVLRAWDGSGLSYGTDTAVDQVMASVINYGPGTELTFYDYYLQDPSAWIGGSDPTPEIFKGMQPRPLSTDVQQWMTVLDTDNPNYVSYELLPNNITAAIGEASEITIVETTTDANAKAASAGFSASVKLLGFNTSVGWEGNVDYSMDFETKTSMEYSLGWKYNLHECTASASCCISHMEVAPYLLVPNDDTSGYNAPWISDDIRTYQKPLPWCLSYVSFPSSCYSGSSVKLWVDKAQGTLFLDKSEPNRDRASAELTLKGLARDFSLRSLSGEQLVHIRLGNYTINSEANYVLTRGFQGKDLLLRLKESEDSDSFITVRLSYNKAKSKLDIDLDADRIDLSGLKAYVPFNTGSSGGEVKTISFGLFLGGKYYAEGELDVRCAVNKQKAICNLHSK